MQRPMANCLRAAEWLVAPLSPLSSRICRLAAMHESTLEGRHARDGWPRLLALLFSSTPCFDRMVCYEFETIHFLTLGGKSPWKTQSNNPHLHTRFTLSHRDIFLELLLPVALSSISHAPAPVDQLRSPNDRLDRPSSTLPFPPNSKSSEMPNCAFG